MDPFIRNGLQHSVRKYSLIIGKLKETRDNLSRLRRTVFQNPVLGNFGRLDDVRLTKHIWPEKRFGYSDNTPGIVGTDMILGGEREELFRQQRREWGSPTWKIFFLCFE